MQSLKEQIKQIPPGVRNEMVLRMLVNIAIEEETHVPSHLVTGCPGCGNAEMEEIMDGGSLECDHCQVLYEYYEDVGRVYYKIKKKH